jgi:hypothetical protein
MYKMRHASEDCKRTDLPPWRVNNRLFTLLWLVVVTLCRIRHWNSQRFTSQHSPPGEWNWNETTVPYLYPIQSVQIPEHTAVALSNYAPSPLGLLSARERTRSLSLVSLTPPWPKGTYSNTR